MLQIFSKKTLLTNIWWKVYAESVSLGEDLLENTIPLLADAAHLSLGPDVHDPEDDVSAGAAVTAGNETAAEGGGALHQVDLLLQPVLDDVAWLEHTQTLLHMTCWLSRGTLYTHGLDKNSEDHMKRVKNSEDLKKILCSDLSKTGKQPTIVTLQWSVNHYRNLALIK